MLFEGFFRILGVFAFIPINYYYDKSKLILYQQIFLNITGFSQLFLTNTIVNEQDDINSSRQYKAFEDKYLHLNYLMYHPLFSDRKKNVKLMRQEYYYANRKANFSIVLSTFERLQCFERVIKHLLSNRPNSTEIIISDDASRSIDKLRMLRKVADTYLYQDVYVIIHTKNFGAFHTKLDGFLFSVGKFIMSIDDDDFFDDLYYIELSSKTTEAISENKNINFIIALDFPYVKRWVKLPLLVTRMISGFHNHVDFSFRRSLLANVNYPPQSQLILRDDAPLMIPLYSQTNDSQIYYFHNQYKYLVDQKYYVSRQSNSLLSNKQKVLEGYNFLVKYFTGINRTDLLTFVKYGYSQYLR